ncbi:hypothetical protein [Acinetobacter sp.]|uniref:hypothetical protein n=1 Tax=Acinetobacter sp. TaxID=472 RepID=UPI00388D5F53
MNFKLIAYIIAAILIGLGLIFLAARVAITGAIVALVLFFGLLGYIIYYFSRRQ